MYRIYPSPYNISQISSIYYKVMDKFHTLWGGNFIVHRLIDRNGSVWKIQCIQNALVNALDSVLSS